MDPQVNRTLIIHGWNVGFRKVEFTKMLQSELSLGLLEAKKTTDKILDMEAVELDIDSQNYARIAQSATELGAVVVTKEMETHG